MAIENENEPQKSPSPPKTRSGCGLLLVLFLLLLAVSAGAYFYFEYMTAKYEQKIATLEKEKAQLEARYAGFAIELRSAAEKEKMCQQQLETKRQMIEACNKKRHSTQSDL